MGRSGLRVTCLRETREQRVPRSPLRPLTHTPAGSSASILQMRRRTARPHSVMERGGLRQSLSVCSREDVFQTTQDTGQTAPSKELHPPPTWSERRGAFPLLLSKNTARAEHTARTCPGSLECRGSGLLRPCRLLPLYPGALLSVHPSVPGRQLLLPPGGKLRLGWRAVLRMKR